MGMDVASKDDDDCCWVGFDVEILGNVGCCCVLVVMVAVVVVIIVGDCVGIAVLDCTAAGLVVADGLLWSCEGCCCCGGFVLVVTAGLICSLPSRMAGLENNVKITKTALMTAAGRIHFRKVVADRTGGDGDDNVRLLLLLDNAAAIAMVKGYFKRRECVMCRKERERGKTLMPTRETHTH